MPVKLTCHIINPVNDKLHVEAVDQPGAGGAYHVYEVSWGDADDSTGLSQRKIVISFQNGPIAENGVNGITQEVLLAIIKHRLECFQAGPFACRDNAVALTHIDSALLWLKKRTLERMERGVEGTNKV